MDNRRLEVLLPADVPARDYAAVANAIWAVLDSAGLDADDALRPDDVGVDDEGPEEGADGRSHDER